MIYSLLYASSIILFFLRNVSIHISIKLWYGICFLVFLSLLVGLRSDIGHDFDTYGYLYLSIKPLEEYSSLADFINHTSKYHGEVGFDFLISFSKFLNFNFNVFLIFHTLTLLCLLYGATQYFKVDFFKALFIFIVLYLVYYLFSYLRFSIVAVGFLWALKYVVERQFFRYLSAMSILSLFHIAALSFIPLYFLKFKINRVNSFLIIGSAIFLQQVDILNLINTTFLQFQLLPGLNYYLTSTGDLHKQGAISLTPIFYIIAFFVNLELCRGLFKTNQVLEILLRIQLMGVFVLLVVIDFTLISARLSGALFMVLVIIFPMVYSQLTNRILKSSYFLMFFTYGTLLYFKMIYVDQNYMVPYQSIL